jgi:membrane protein DedA with SNARE-associated domain
MDPMLSEPLAFMSAHPGLVVALVFVAAALEYVFPPFWGDTVMLAGCALAGLDRASALGVFGAAFAGSCVGALAAYALGRRLGRAALGVLGRSERARRLALRAERLYDDHGARVLAVNRFLPGVRGVFLPLAGMGNMAAGRVLLWSAFSNLLWCALLLGVGLAVGSESGGLTGLEGRFRTASVVAAGIALTVVAGLTVRHVLVRRRCSKAS